jgi:hypothetical protein
LLWIDEGIRNTKDEKKKTETMNGGAKLIVIPEACWLRLDIHHRSNSNLRAKRGERHLEVESNVGVLARQRRPRNGP